jgi:hypothetical protein
VKDDCELMVVPEPEEKEPTRGEGVLEEYA